ncbi:MAG: DUF445 domain-containing protein [Actinobacteria bacterium]|nr:DUF445 domain-containing protein [Actinomycetota bacterium]
MSFMEATPADAARRAGLRRMRIVATSLLGLAFVVFVLTNGRDEGAWGYVHTASEAAMVGALADWFAVTALFKHPMGLPIPHTALVKKRKDELGRSLEEFVSDNFLTEEIARERLAAAQVGLRLGHWLEEPAHRQRALTEISRVATAALGRMRDADVRDFVVGVLLPRLQQEPVSPIAGSFLKGIVEDKAHHGLVDLGLTEIHDWLVDNPKVFSTLMNERAPWWTPPWVDDRVINWTYQQALAWLRDMRADPEHRARVALDNLLTKLADDLHDDPQVQARAEALKERVLSHPQVGETVLSLWASVRTSLLAAIGDPTSTLWQRGDSWLAEASTMLLTDDATRERLEGHLGDMVAFFVTTYGDELANVISHTVDRWDADEASERIELFVGRDLQFIRINGTIVGALAGVIIHAISTAIG